jgi:hypothetical protein
MKIFDLIHGYQPFQDPVFNFSYDPWVKNNLEKVFYPTSVAMKNGSVKRGINIKGWTIDSWLSSSDDVKKLAKKIIRNLREAMNNRYVEVGFSGYAHPILPLLNKELIIAQIVIDHEITKDTFGEPTWFWPPEGAVSGELLSTLYDFYPEVIVVIPDVSLGLRNYSGVHTVAHHKKSSSLPGFQKVLVCNSLLKDVVMNSVCYPTNPHYELDMEWSHVKQMYFDHEKFNTMLNKLGGNIHVIARDWENMGSVEGLSSHENGGFEIKAFLKHAGDFKLPSEANWSNADVLKIEHINFGSWEVDAHVDDPFIYWWPSEYHSHWQTLNDEQKKWAKRWQGFIKEFNEDFKVWSDKHGGIKNLLNNETSKQHVKDLLPGLMSCIPWHFLAKQLWEPSPEFSKEAWEKIVLPSREKLKSLLK